MKKNGPPIFLCAALIAAGIIGMYFTYTMHVAFPIVSGVLVMAGALGLLYRFLIRSDASDAEREFRVMKEHLEDSGLAGFSTMHDRPVIPKK